MSPGKPGPRSAGPSQPGAATVEVLKWELMHDVQAAIQANVARSSGIQPDRCGGAVARMLQAGAEAAPAHVSSKGQSFGMALSQPVASVCIRSCN